MLDVFFFSHGKTLFEDQNIYDIFFSASRSKTIEHSIYSRSKAAHTSEIKKSQKSKKNEDNIR